MSRDLVFAGKQGPVTLFSRENISRRKQAQGGAHARALGGGAAGRGGRTEGAKGPWYGMVEVCHVVVARGHCHRAVPEYHLATADKDVCSRVGPGAFAAHRRTGAAGRGGGGGGALCALLCARRGWLFGRTS